MSKQKVLVNPEWLSCSTAAQLTSFSEEFIRKEIIEKAAIPVYKDTVSKGKKASVRFRYNDFINWFEVRFGARQA